MDTIPCRNCRKDVSPAGDCCPYCGVSTRPSEKPLVFSTTFVLLLGGLVVYAVVSSSTTAPTSRPAAIVDPAPAARSVCRDFITRRGYNVSDWGQYWSWTTIDNKDGTWSVGARFMGAAPGDVVRNLYVTCTTRNEGENWQLVSLHRLQ